MQRNYRIYAIIAVICGFVLFVSKVPLLFIPAVLLTLWGMFAPFFEDLFRRPAYRPTVGASASKSLRQQGGKAASQDMKVGKAESAGKGREVKSTWEAIQALQKQAPTTTGYTSVILRLSGENLSREEATQAEQLVKLVLDVNEVQVLPDTPFLEGQIDDAHKGKMQVFLEALTEESNKGQRTSPNIIDPGERSERGTD